MAGAATLLGSVLLLPLALAWPANPSAQLAYGPASESIIKLTKVQPNTPATLSGAKLPPNYLNGFLALGSGQELLDGQAKLMRAWNTSEGVGKLIAAGSTGAPVNLPDKFKSGPLNKLLSELVIIYYAMWQGVESARRAYYREVEEAQVVNVTKRGVYGVTARPPAGAQYVPPKSIASAQWINNWFTNEDDAVGNGVTAYSQAYFDLGNGPLVLTFPAINDYYLITLYNIYGEVISTIGTRVGTKGEKKILLVDENAPKNAALEAKFAKGDIVRVPGADAIGLSRILGQQRSKEYKVEPAEPGKKLSTATYWWGTDASIYYIYPGVGLDPLYFWKVAGLVLARNPRQGLTAAQRALLKELHFGPDGLDADKLTPDQAQALIAAIPIAAQGIAQSFYMIGPKEHGYWYNTAPWNSKPGEDYQKNAAYFKGFWIANIGVNAAYLIIFVDSQARPLSGRFDYSMSFAKPPPAQGAFWSLQTARLDQFAMADALDYLNTKDFGYVGYVYGPALADSEKSASNKGGSKLVTAADGSFNVTLSAKPKPAGFSGNFLKIAGDAPFYIILRIYNPTQVVVEDKYAPPPVVRTGSLPGV